MWGQKMEMEKIGALWYKASKNGSKFLSGTIKDINIVIYRNKYKKEANQPDYNVFMFTDKNQNKGGKKENGK